MHFERATSGIKNPFRTALPAESKEPKRKKCINLTTLNVLLMATCFAILTLLPKSVFANVPGGIDLFKITVDATIADDTAAGSFRIPSPLSEYNVYWEEVGNAAGNNSGGAIYVNSAQFVVNFGSSGTYRVGIQPTGSNPFYQFNFAASGDDKKLLTVEQWGTAQWTTMANAFNGASNLTTISAGDFPDLSSVTTTAFMFNDATSLTSITGIEFWNTSNIQNMASMFKNAALLDPDVGSWNTSSVYNMHSMFNLAANANPDVSLWDTSSVITMASMFQNASIADPNVSSWDTSSVGSFRGMFWGATNADPAVGGWDTSSAYDMYAMFNLATSANPDVSSWDTSSVTYVIHD